MSHLQLTRPALLSSFHVPVLCESEISKAQSLPSEAHSLVEGADSHSSIRFLSKTFTELLLCLSVTEPPSLEEPSA